MQIHGSVILNSGSGWAINYGSGSCLDIFVAIEKMLLIRYQSKKLNIAKY